MRAFGRSQSQGIIETAAPAGNVVCGGTSITPAEPASALRMWDDWFPAERARPDSSRPTRIK
jgi:hypothetical protein